MFALLHLFQKKTDSKLPIDRNYDIGWLIVTFYN